MKGVIFFVYLCFLFTRGYDIVYMGMLENSMGYAAHDFTKTHQLKFPGKYLLGEDFEDEDEDDDQLPAHKDKISIRRYISNYFRSCFKVRLSFYCRLCYKYITQRALRI